LRPGKADGPDSSFVMLEAKSLNINGKITIHLQEPIKPLLDLVGLGGICLEVDNPFSWFLVGPIDIRDEGSQGNADLSTDGVGVTVDSSVVGDVNHLPRAVTGLTVENIADVGLSLGSSGEVLEIVWIGNNEILSLTIC